MVVLVDEVSLPEDVASSAEGNAATSPGQSKDRPGDTVWHAR